jgi:sarcosine oxidase subunit beta
MNKVSAEVAIIGGGVRGLAIAFGLAKAGVDVILLEKSHVAAGASGLNMGYVNISAKKPAFYTRFSKISADMYPDFNEALGGDIEYERNGSLNVAETEEEWTELSKVVDERNTVSGMEMRMLNIDEVRQLEPNLSPHLLGGFYCPIDGGVNPLKLTRALARAASRKGARIFTGREVYEIRAASGRIEEVVTSRETISTHVVVNAAGIHVPGISQMVGIEVPVYPERGQIIITEALPLILNRTVGDYKQYADGQVLMGTTNEKVGENKSVTVDMISSRTRRAIRIIPALQRARAIRCAAALRPMTPDRRPIYQKIDGISDFYIAVGHSGITLAPITSKIFSELITRGKTDIAIDEYRLERFKGI